MARGARRPAHLRVDVVTIFPGMFRAVLGESILKRAQARGVLDIRLHDLRRFTHDRRRSVDDRPYGGGPGMVLMPGPIYEAVESIRQTEPAGRRPHVVLLSPSGSPFTSARAQRLAARRWLILLCGHYEGVDERVLRLVRESVSIGDYVLTGGELPAMVVMDAVARFVPGVVGHADATAEESFTGGLLEYPQYTRPAVFRTMAVPSVLRSGDHRAIARWRRLQATARTAARRPDLLGAAPRRGRTLQSAT